MTTPITITVIVIIRTILIVIGITTIITVADYSLVFLNIEHYYPRPLPLRKKTAAWISEAPISGLH